MRAGRERWGASTSRPTPGLQGEFNDIPGRSSMATTIIAPERRNDRWNTPRTT